MLPVSVLVIETFTSGITPPELSEILPLTCASWASATPVRNNPNTIVRNIITPCRLILDKRYHIPALRLPARTAASRLVRRTPLIFATVDPNEALRLCHPGRAAGDGRIQSAPLQRARLWRIR